MNARPRTLSAVKTRISGQAAVLTFLLATVLLLAGCGSSDQSSAAVVPSAGTATSATSAESPSNSVHSGHSTAIPATMALRTGERFLELSMRRPYTPAPPSGGTDDYRCFIVDPKLTRTTYLTGSQFLPNNPAIVHHAIFFKLESKDIGAAKKLDAASPQDGWTCFTGTGLGNQATQLRGAPWLAAWAPGGGENLNPKGTGFKMEAGSQVIMQIHYNLLATGGKATGSDQSGIRLRLAPDNGKITPLHTTLLVAPIELPCPAGETGPLCNRDSAVFDVMHRFGDTAGSQVAGLNILCNNGGTPRPGNTQHCDRDMRSKMVVYAVAGHMHLLGKSIRVDLNPGTPKAKNLLDVPVYNFDDQGARALAAPVTVKAGDDLRVTCTHDATLRSKLPALKTLPPRYVVWGEGTSDEMCLGVVVWADKIAST